MERPHLRLTPGRIKSAVPQGGDLWLSDDTGVWGIGRLLLRVSQTGSKLFYYRPPRATGSKPVPLGPYSHSARAGFLTLSQARIRCAEETAKFQVALRGATSSAEALKGGEAGVSLSSLCAAYVEYLKSENKSSHKDAEGYFRREVYSHRLGERAAASITTKEFVRFFRALIAAKGGYTAMKVRSFVSSAYSMAQQSALDPTIAFDFDIDENPVVHIPALSKYMKARDRSLRRKELAALLERLCLTKAGDASLFIRAIRLSLLLGGQRYEQLLKVGLSDVDIVAETIELQDPKGRRAKPRRHLLPILPALKPEVEWLINRAQGRGSSWLFVGPSKDEPIDANGVSKLLSKMALSLVEAGRADDKFQLSDLRRTAETQMASMGVSNEHRAHLLSHGLGGVQDRHYNLYDYWVEKQEALGKWHALLRELQPDFI